MKKKTIDDFITISETSLPGVAGGGVVFHSKFSITMTLAMTQDTLARAGADVRTKAFGELRYRLESELRQLIGQYEISLESLK